MKLTKELRTQISDSVMDATTYAAEQAEIQKATADLIRAALLSRVPTGFRGLTEGMPPEWFCYTANYSLHRNIAPGHVFQYGVFSSQAHWHNCRIDFEPFARPAQHDDKLTEKELAKVAVLRQKSEKLYDKFETIRAELNGFLASCTTSEKVLARMPELEPHMPVAAKTYPIVASTSNLLSSLLKSGFVVAPPNHT